MTLSTATRKRMSALRLLAARYAMEEIPREEYLAERRRLLNQVERDLRTPAEAPKRSGPVPRPEETPGHGNRVVLLVIAVLVVVGLALLFLR